MYVGGSRYVVGGSFANRAVPGISSACTPDEMTAYLQTRKGVTMTVSNITASGATLTFTPFTGRYLSYVGTHQMPSFEKHRHGFIYLSMIAQNPYPHKTAKSCHSYPIGDTVFFSFGSQNSVIYGMSGKYWNVPKLQGPDDCCKNFPTGFHLLTYEEARTGTIALESGFVTKLYYTHHNIGHSNTIIQRNRRVAMDIETDGGISGLPNYQNIPYSNIY